MDDLPDVQLYSIAGFWNVRDGPFFKFAFGGYFKKTKDMKFIEGELIDRNGPSVIRGEMTDKYLEFIKTYTNEESGLIFRPRNISYKLQKNKDGKFVGEYEPLNGGDKKPDEVEMLVSLVTEDAVDAMTGPSVPAPFYFSVSHKK